MPLSTVDAANIIAGAVKTAVQEARECKTLEEIATEKGYESWWKKSKIGRDQS